jgi:hypothetical protein
MGKITFRSRYGYEVFLKKISESRYELDGSYKILQMTKEADGNIRFDSTAGQKIIELTQNTAAFPKRKADVILLIKKSGRLTAR